MLQLIILKSCEDKWQAEDKSTDSSDQSEMEEKKWRRRKDATKSAIVYELHMNHFPLV